MVGPLGAIVVGWAQAGPVSKGAGRPAEDLCRSGGDRSGERAALPGGGGQEPRSGRIARAADSDERDPARYLAFASYATPVFETIVVNAARLCHANFAAALLYDGERLRSAAHTTVTPAFAEYFKRGYPMSRETTTGRAALERTTVQVADILNDREFVVTAAHRDEGVRTVLAVPMLHEGALLGVITTWRLEVRPFTGEQIRLLETFADQAVIAIENARVFRELQAAGRRLEAQAAELAQMERDP